MALSEVPYGVVDVAHRGEVEVGNVHADLARRCQDTDGFDAVEASVGSADIAGDGAGGGDVGLFEVDVVGDEKAAGSDGAGTGGFVELGAANVGTASSVAANGVAKAFELALATSSSWTRSGRAAAAP